MCVAPFESLRVWHEARFIVARVYAVTSGRMLVRDRALCEQMRRAAISAMSNVAEGHERGGDRELRRFLLIARGTCGEVRSQLYAAEDLGYIEKRVATELRTKVASLSRALSALSKRIESRMERR
jgi:four helix bundle protein